MCSLYGLKLVEKTIEVVSATAGTAEVRPRSGCRGECEQQASGSTMTLCPYNSDELKQLHRVLEGIIREAQQRNLTLAVDDIIERVFDLADHGERDPEKLRETVLKLAA